MDHQHPTHDAKKPSPAPPKSEDLLSAGEYAPQSINPLEIGKVQSASGILNRGQVIALQRMVGNRETRRLLNHVSQISRRIQRFEKQADVRKNQFISSATDDKKLTPKQAEELYAMVSG